MLNIFDLDTIVIIKGGIYMSFGVIAPHVLLVLGSIIVLFFGFKLIKTVFSGFIAVMVIGLFVIAILAALPYIPKSPPAQWDLPTEQMRKAQQEGRLDVGPIMNKAYFSKHNHSNH